MRRAVFLDRDGTIMEDREYLADPRGVALLPGAAEALRRLRALGYLLVVVSNQSGVARGLMTEADVRAVNEALLRELGRGGATVDAFYYCPHHPDHGSPPHRAACDCRKPGPGMVLAAARDLGISLEGSVVVGDKAEDVDLGVRLGMPAYLVTTGKGATAAAGPAAERATAVVGGLGEVADLLGGTGT